jgi:hypothetical protein
MKLAQRLDIAFAHTHLNQGIGGPMKRYIFAALLTLGLALSLGVAYAIFDAGRVNRAMVRIEASIDSPKAAPYLSEAMTTYRALETRASTPESKALFRRVRIDQTYRLASEYSMRKKLLGLGATSKDMNKLNRLLWDKITRIDSDNRDWLKVTLKNINWFKTSVYGKEASHAAWLLVQHGDLDHAWQKQMLVTLDAMAKQKEASAQDVAYLEDRIAVSENRPQTYATQGQCQDGVWNPMPLRSPEKVDQLRQSVGLKPLAAYRAQFKNMCQYQ